MPKHLCAICGDYLVKVGKRRKRVGRRFGGKLVHRGCLPRDKQEQMVLLERFRSGDYADKRYPACGKCALRKRIKLLEKKLKEAEDELKNLEYEYRDMQERYDM